jgi:hypothetical protein
MPGDQESGECLCGFPSPSRFPRCLIVQANVRREADHYHPTIFVCPKECSPVKSHGYAMNGKNRELNLLLPSGEEACMKEGVAHL